MSKVNECLLKHGVITKAAFDVKEAKVNKLKQAKVGIKGKDLSKLSTAKLIAIIEELR